MNPYQAPLIRPPPSLLIDSIRLFIRIFRRSGCPKVIRWALAVRKRKQAVACDERDWTLYRAAPAHRRHTKKELIWLQSHLHGTDGR
jgi:hypothetical protein